MTLVVDEWSHVHALAVLGKVPHLPVQLAVLELGNLGHLAGLICRDPQPVPLGTAIGIDFYEALLG